MSLYIIKVSSPALPPVPVDLGDIVEFNRIVSGSIAALRGGAMFPVGFIALTAEAKAPVGWVVCDGLALDRSAFPALFAAIGTAYGAGDGVTTFNIPTQSTAAPSVLLPPPVTPPQNVTGGSIDPPASAVPPDPSAPSENVVGGSGGGNVIGGRVPAISGVERER